MFKNNFKIAFRNLSRNKVSSIINIGGLTIGIAVALLIGLWVYDELSFNKYHRSHDRIARIMVSGNDVDHGAYINSSLPYPLATEIRDRYNSNFTRIVRASWVQDYIISAGEKMISRRGQFMDKEAPEMLTLNMLEGTRKGLSDPNSILLSESTAKALFGKTPALNQIVRISNKTNVSVTGVYEDLPLNSEFTSIKFISSWDLWVSENKWISERAMDNWKNNFLRLYAEIKPGTDFETVNQAVKNAMLDKIRLLDNYKEQVARNPAVFLHPMNDWHLHPIDRRAAMDKKPVRMLWMVGTIGLFVLLLACINFMNLSTARSEKRAKEVGIRKTIGSQRRQLVWQFFSEALLVTMFSFILACILVVSSIGWFNNISGKEMEMPWGDRIFWLISLGFIFFTALLAGSYPAFYLSSFKPVKVLKGTFRAGRLAAVPRKAMVVMQFTISVTLIICTIVIFQQLQLGRNRPVGYKPEGLIMVPMLSEDFNGKHDLFRTELLNTGVVTSFSQSMGKITEVSSGNNGFDWKGKTDEQDKSFGTLAVSHEHGKTIGWQFLEGRDFARDNKSDSSAVVINESAALYMGLKNPVGEVITWEQGSNPPQPYTVIGVIRDALMESPYKDVEPTMFFVKALNGGVNWINIRINSGVQFREALPKIETVFKKLVPSAPFDYTFADEEYGLKFQSEERAGKLAVFFAVFAVFISCLGLFGLASFTAEQRTKEIGVRKILGASIYNLWRLLSKEFVLLVVISFFIAVPVAYYFMNGWLETYQYRASLSWWIFAAACAGALVITLITVSFQAIKAAIANPVKSMRSE